MCCITRPNCALDRRIFLCLCVLGDKYLNMFQNVSGFHLQVIGGLRVHILVT